MSEPFLGEIQMFAFNFPPRGWALCNGQLMSIQQNTALFSLLGTTYGGNGQTTFGLPDMRSRVPMHLGNGNPQGTRAGEETHTLLITEMPSHNHTHNASNVTTGATVLPAGNAFGTSGASIYATQNGGTAISIGSSGASQGHNNIQPYVTVNFCIATQGIFPSRN